MNQRESGNLIGKSNSRMVAHGLQGYSCIASFNLVAWSNGFGAGPPTEEGALHHVEVMCYCAVKFNLASH